MYRINLIRNGDVRSANVRNGLCLYAVLFLHQLHTGGNELKGAEGSRTGGRSDQNVTSKGLLRKKLLLGGGDDF